MSFSRSLKERTKKVWEECYQHSFLQELGRGTLERDKFRFYMLQDYVYLIEYAKIFAMGVVKSSEEKYMCKFAEVQHGILKNEMNIHREYMKKYGISQDEVDSVEQSLFNRAYTANMITVAQTEGIAELVTAVFPCAWTYYDYAKRLKEDYQTELEGNFYKEWIEGYASEEFKGSFEWFYDYLDDLCKNKSESELARLEKIFEESIQFEYLFWDMAYNKKMSY